MEYQPINPNAKTQEPTPQEYYPPQQQSQVIYATSTPYYGNTTGTTTYQTVVHSDVNIDLKYKQDESNAMLLLVLGFFVGGICWIIAYSMYRNSPNPKARSYARTSLILFVMFTGIAVLSLVVFFILFFVLFNVN
ncbi:hypothetical protein ABK040_014032 [Willaertia magna]